MKVQCSNCGDTYDEGDCEWFYIEYLQTYVCEHCHDRLIDSGEYDPETGNMRDY